MDLERGACTCKIRQKNHAPLRATTTMVERKDFFVRNQMSKGQSQSRCDQNSKLRASQSQSSTSQSPNRLRVKVQTRKTAKESSTRKLRVKLSWPLDGKVHDFLTSRASQSNRRASRLFQISVCPAPHNRSPAPSSVRKNTYEKLCQVRQARRYRAHHSQRRQLKIRSKRELLKCGSPEPFVPS